MRSFAADAQRMTSTATPTATPSPLAQPRSSGRTGYQALMAMDSGVRATGGWPG